MNQNEAYQNQIHNYEKQLKKEEAEQRDHEQKNKELEQCLKHLQVLSKQIKETELFQQYGYVLKKDIVNVYQRQKNNNQYMEQDVLLLIQAPEGSQLNIPQESYEKHQRNVMTRNTRCEKHDDFFNSQDTNVDDNKHMLDVIAPKSLLKEGQEATKQQKIWVEHIELD